MQKTKYSMIYVIYNLYNTSSKGTFIDTESSKMIVWGWGRSEN